ncbi:transmembrane protein, partial [Cystoisospora suis]
RKRILSAVVARSSSSSSFLSLSLKNSLPPPLLLNGEKKEVEKSKKSIACLNRIEEEKDKEEREKETDGVQREKGERSFFVDLSSLHLRRLDFPLLIDASRIQEISLRSNSLTDRCWYNSHLPYLFSLRRLDLHGNLQLTLLLPLLLTLANLPYLQLVDLSSTGLRCTKEEEETDTFHLLEFLLLRESRKRTYKSKQEENEREEEEEGEREEKGHASLLLSSLVRSPKCIDISDTPLSRSFSLDGNRSPLSSTSSPEGEEGQRNAKEEEKEEKEAKKKEKRIWNCYAVVEKEVYIHPNDSEKKTEKVMSISAKEKEEWERSEKKEKREKESPKDKKKEEEEKEEEDEGKGSACIPNHNYTKEQKEKEEEKENSHLPSSLFPREEDQEKTMNEEKKHAEEIYHDDKEKKEERRRHVSTKLFLIEERK